MFPFMGKDPFGLPGFQQTRLHPILQLAVQRHEDGPSSGGAPFRAERGPWPWLHAYRNVRPRETTPRCAGWRTPAVSGSRSRCLHPHSELRQHGPFTAPDPAFVGIPDNGQIGLGPAMNTPPVSPAAEAAPQRPAEQDIQQLGRQIFERMKGEKPGLFDAWSGKLMDWAMKDEAFKLNMFRFVDVLPSLRTADAVQSHVQEYLMNGKQELPAVLSWGIGMAGSGGLMGNLAATAMKKNITQMAERFIVGQSGKDAIKELRGLHKDGMAFTVDLLGEAAVNDQESRSYLARYQELVETLAAQAAGFKPEPLVDGGPDGIVLPRVNVSLKLSALDCTVNTTDVTGSTARVLERVLPLVLRARQLGVFINLDMEQFVTREITYRVFEGLCRHAELRDWPHLGVVVQAYLRDSEADLDRLIALARSRGTPITVRLVKGAYWDYETVLAQQRGWPCPVFSEKSHTDANYERLSLRMLQHHHHVRPAFGSHNIRSLATALAAARQMKIPDNVLEVQMLYGMAEPARKAMRNMGLRVRVYAPVGELLPGMAYLVRRLLENTSNQGFLANSYAAGVDPAALLAAPAPAPQSDPALVPLLHTFPNLPLLDLAQPAEQDAMRSALAQVESQWLGADHPAVVGGEKLTNGQWETSVNPARPAQVIGRVASAQPADAQRALEAAQTAYPAWVDTPVEVRTQVLERAAQLMEQDRLRLAALILLETGKPWREADADVAEAVDFCRYYAQHARELHTPKRVGLIPGEFNELTYQGRGVAVVIAPWNFPLAILCGMTTAALVTGNTVIMKPAEQSAVIGAHLFRILVEAGAPAGVLQFLPGRGEVVGAHLVQSPLTDMVAFTGSMQVGLAIAKAAGTTAPEQRNVKRVVVEMGGKNAVVVDSDADLDEAVVGVLQSAFGYAGQKCSACSRVLVVQDAYEAFCERLGHAVADLVVGDPADPATVVPPVVDAEAQQRLLQRIAEFRKTQKVLAEKKLEDVLLASGCYVPPIVFHDVAPDHSLMQDELFGPVVAVTSVATFDEALVVANATRYALTGSVFSRSPGNLAKARRQFKVGNLYLNRGTTGALVGRQPFGGFKMSGAGSKAGGPDYLLHFVDPVCVTENTMRRGFTPADELDDDDGVVL